MPANQFVANGRDDVGDGEMTILDGDLGVKDALEEHVAQFAGQRLGVAAVDGVQHFVALLQKKGSKGLVRLLEVPWAAVPGPQRAHDVSEPREGRTGASVIAGAGRPLWSP